MNVRSGSDQIAELCVDGVYAIFRFWRSRTEFVICGFQICVVPVLGSDLAPIQFEVLATYELASVSNTMASQVRAVPLAQGISVRPSGRLPSILDRLGGSSVSKWREYSDSFFVCGRQILAPSPRPIQILMVLMSTMCCCLRKHWAICLIRVFEVHQSGWYP